MYCTPVMFLTSNKALRWRVDKQLITYERFTFKPRNNLRIIKYEIILNKVQQEFFWEKSKNCIRTVGF